MIKFYFLLDLMFVDTALFFVCDYWQWFFVCRIFFVGFIKSLMSLSEHVHIKITVKKNKKKNREIFHCLCPEGVE